MPIHLVVIVFTISTEMSNEVRSAGGFDLRSHDGAAVTDGLDCGIVKLINRNKVSVQSF